jgi:hypothetical protein
MSIHSARDPVRLATITPRFTPHSPCGPIEPILPALLRSLVFFSALAAPFIIALFVA